MKEADSLDLRARIAVLVAVTLGGAFAGICGAIAYVLQRGLVAESLMPALRIVLGMAGLGLASALAGLVLIHVMLKVGDR